MPTDWTRRPLWLAYLACGLLVWGAGLALPDLAYSVVDDLVGLSADVAILCGVRLHRPARRGIWYGLAAGLAVFVAGDVVYSVYAYALHLEPFPSPADALYLASIRYWRPPWW